MADKVEGTLAWLRHRNRQHVIDFLRERGASSQSEIARATGLSRTTVHTLVGELREAGKVDEVETKRPGERGGRPALTYTLRESFEAVVGIDFGHSHVQVAVADIGHHVLAECRADLDVNHQARRALEMSAEMVSKVLADAGVRRADVRGVGIGIPGPVDRTHGTAGSSTILPDWVGLGIAGEMKERLGLPVEIENDANLGALAEMTWGAGRDCLNFAYVKAATGIGAGLVIDGRLIRGASGTAGEIGHTTLDERGILCYCGNRGCLETVASGPAILKLVGAAGAEGLTIPRVVELALAGDVRCRRAVSDAGREIGVAVAGLCNLINPERIIIGGLISRAGRILLNPMRESIRRHAVQAAAERVEVLPAVFVERAELLGALALALHGHGPLPEREMEVTAEARRISVSA